jgi:predicted ATPase
MDMLTTLDIQGYKSILELKSFHLGALNVLIGANGSGKSNVISFFRLLNWMTPSPGNLQFFIGRAGGAQAIVHDGVAVTPQMSAALSFETQSGRNEYFFRLFHAAPDTLIFAEERIRYTPNTADNERDWVHLGAGHREAALLSRAEQGDKTARVILSLLKQCVVYQFHNTSETARVKQKWNINDNRFLKEDGANLAPFLLRLRDTEPKYYARIVETIRQIAPFFADFVLEPLNGTVILQWRERNTDLVFGPHQASDGTLRVMALIALLLQPEKELPLLIILDEPELGLHPYAINVLAGLLQSVSLHAQVILATQSMTLLDYFQPDQIVVVDRPDRSSTFRRLEEDKLADWLEEYSIAELWEKNVLGGKPTR